MFRFKQFAIEQDACPMKVGTDGVLLGAWVSLSAGDRRILDIGTGTGVIALMLAQRSSARITAIDIDPACARQAAQNVASSPWRERVEVICTPLQRFAVSGYDLIVSNPPYYDDSLLPPDRGRCTARHTVHLPFDDLIAGVCGSLAPEGRFAVVLPAPEAARFCMKAAGRLFPSRRTEVWSTPTGGVKRCLMEFRREAVGAVVPDRLVIQDGDRAFTADYRRLTGDFYLKF